MFFTSFRQSFIKCAMLLLTTKKIWHWKNKTVCHYKNRDDWRLNQSVVITFCFVCKIVVYFSCDLPYLESLNHVMSWKF